GTSFTISGLTECCIDVIERADQTQPVRTANDNSCLLGALLQRRFQALAVAPISPQPELNMTAVGTPRCPRRIMQSSTACAGRATMARSAGSGSDSTSGQHDKPAISSY